MAECIDHPLRVDHVRRRRLSSTGSASDEHEDEALDPRIQVELEKLNKSSEEINKLELELDDARASFRQALSDSTQKLNALAKKLGACVEKARPYYEARVKCKEAHQETQKAAIRFERACSMHEAAKEMVQLAEQGYIKREHSSDPAWQEMLNHATMKVNEAEKERLESEMEHQRTTKIFQEADVQVQMLQKELKRAIAKSKPYFEMKVKFNQMMEEHKRKVGMLEEDVTSTKALYAQALRNLEAISDEIHQQRLDRQKKRQLGKRGSGVGAESPSPPPTWDKGGGRVEGRDTPPTSTDSAVRVPHPSKASPRESLKSDVYSASTLPSVIRSNPADSRRESYRRAMNPSTSEMLNSPDSVNSADYNEDYDIPSLEEEFMSLPPSQSSQESVRTWIHHPLESPNSDVQCISSSPQNTGAEEDVFQTVQPRRQESRERSSSQPPNDVASHSPSQPHPTNRQRSLSGTEGQKSPRPISTGSTPPVGSPASSSPATVRKSKLQGLILRVDPTMDPLQQVLNPRSIQQKTTTARPSQYYTTSASTAPQVSASPRPVDQPTLTSNSSVKASPGGKRAMHRTGSGLSEEDQTLRVPGAGSSTSTEGVEDSSDTESIASTGPMLDDDQVELLTLDFSKEPVVRDDVPPASFRRQNWSRMSLPPRLSYLEGYVKRKSREFEGHNSSIQEQMSEESLSPEDPLDRVPGRQQT